MRLRKMVLLQPIHCEAQAHWLAETGYQTPNTVTQSRCSGLMPARSNDGRYEQSRDAATEQSDLEEDVAGSMRVRSHQHQDSEEICEGNASFDSV